MLWTKPEDPPGLRFRFAAVVDRLHRNEPPAAKGKNGYSVVTQMTNDADERIDDAPGAGKILLIGDITDAFPDAGAVNGSRYEVCASVEDAIDAAAKNDFAAIVVVLSAIPSDQIAALKKLRDHYDAKIILLARMYEEPMAIQLVSSAHNGARLAHDYLICPVQTDALYESVTVPGKLPSRRIPEPELYRPIQIRVPAPDDEAVQTRIRHLERLATEDDLTGLKNRRYIREFARQIIEHARKENGQVTLLMFDIDNFKRYNDLYGHSTGDGILRQAAVLVRRCCRSHDVVGRIGGDEFAVVFWDEPQLAGQSTIDNRQSRISASGGVERRSASADHPTEVLAIAKRFIEELEKAELSSLDGLGPEGKGVLTISGGLATFPRDAHTSQELFLQADKALLEAKRSGKNQIYLVGKPQNDVTGLE